jgi:hypothetical protein
MAPNGEDASKGEGGRNLCVSRARARAEKSPSKSRRPLSAFLRVAARYAGSARNPLPTRLLGQPHSQFRCLQLSPMHRGAVWMDRTMDALAGRRSSLAVDLPDKRPTVNC